MAALTSCGVQGKHLQGTLHAYTLRARSHTHTHTPAALGVHTPCSWAPQHSDTHRGAPILRPRQSYRHTPSHTDVHISGYTLTYTHTYPCTSSYKLTCHPPELHTHTQLSTRTLSRDAHTHHQIHPKPGLHMQHTGVDAKAHAGTLSPTQPHTKYRHTPIQVHKHVPPQAHRHAPSRLQATH